jgi:mRNA-degrading endonuclease RelE of RelBE toxin-antitoxin system
MKQQAAEHRSDTLPEDGRKKGVVPSQQLVMEEDDQNHVQHRKRKSKGSGVRKLHISTYLLLSALL